MSLVKSTMLNALRALDQEINRPFTIIIGGGGALVLAHNFSLSTNDIDAIPKDLSVDELDPFVKQVARDLDIPGDWLNPYYSTFTHVLPSDYGSRLISVFKGKKLSALALSKNDLLIMKCFAHRPKDVPHAKALIQAGADAKFAEKHIEVLQAKRIPGCQDALDFLDEVLEQLE